MFCKKCGTSIIEGAGFCPNCGEPVGTVNGANTANDMNVINNTGAADSAKAGGGQNQVMPPVSALWNMYSQDAQSANAQSVGAQSANTKQGGFTKGITMEGKGKKFFADHKILLIAGAAVVAVLLLVVFNITAIGNFLRRTFSSPEEYYHYVEKKTVEELSADAGEMYTRYFLDNLDTSDRSVSMQFGMKLGEGGQELMELAELVGLADVDMSWLESMSFSMDSSTKRDAVAMGLGVVVNEVNILTGNVVLDLDDEVVYFQMPEINKQYMGVEIPSGGLNDMEQLWEMYEMLERICPDQKEVERLTNRYLMIVVESMDDVTKKAGVLKAEGIEQKCTVLTVTADINTLKNMTEEILRQMRDDKDIEKIIKEAVADEDFMKELYLDDMSPEECYAEFQDWIDDEVEDLEDLGELDVYDDESLKMRVYVNRKGKIVGRTVKMGDVTIDMLMPEKGKQFGYELSCKDSYYEESMSLTGAGSRSGDKIDGEFVLEYDNTPILDVEVQDLNTEEMKKGMLNGRMILSLSKDVVDLLGYMPYMSMIQGMELSMNFKSDSNSGSCKMSVSVKDKDLADITMAYQRKKGYNGADPGKNVVMVEDMDDLIEWGEDLNLDGLSNALEEANVPSEITDSLEMLEDMDLESILRMMYYYY